VGKWNEAFTDEGAFTKPPETSIGLFLSHEGSIFQVPEGTTSFQFALDEPVTYYFQPRFNDPQVDVVDLAIRFNIFLPVFVTSLNNLSIPPGGSGTFEITAVNPSTSNSGLGLAWDVKNLPPWLTVSQTSGASSARLMLNVAPGTALGAVASINVNTNPEFAAPSVEINPLLVRVTVGQPNDTGILLTGGNDAQGHWPARGILLQPPSSMIRIPGPLGRPAPWLRSEPAILRPRFWTEKYWSLAGW
jgi:hypothetical protein